MNDVEHIADKLIYLWSGDGNLIKRFKGSPEPARGLSHLIDGEGFASACNDGYVYLPRFSCLVSQSIGGHTWRYR